MTKMMRAKLNFYKQQTIQRDADRVAAKAVEEAVAGQQRLHLEQSQQDNMTLIYMDQIIMD